MTLPASKTWVPDITLRMRRHFLLKLSGTSILTGLFFIGYFHVLRHPVHPVITMPLTALDRLIPFQPQTLVAYLSLWIYVGLAPGLQSTVRELIAYALWVGSLCVTGLGIFYFFPTVVPPQAIDAAGFPVFAMLQSVDAAGNACPSMHVAVAMFTAIRVDHTLRQIRVPFGLRLANAAWFAAIAYSTLATRQHVVVDVACGALLGTGFALASLRGRGVDHRTTATTIATDPIRAF